MTRYFLVDQYADLTQTYVPEVYYSKTYPDKMYIKYEENQEYGYLDPSWQEVTEEQLREDLGYNPFLGEIDPNQPYPEPDPVDPTMSQLVNIIVETSVNVDYLVSMQSFQ